jgi:hypothetical protein
MPPFTSVLQFIIVFKMKIHHAARLELLHAKGNVNDFAEAVQHGAIEEFFT